MKKKRTFIEGLNIITPNRYVDDRGYFSESYNKLRYVSDQIEEEFVQDNHVYTKCAGTIRGLHFQNPPHAQSKLVRCISGRIRDVALDIRLGSPTFGNYFSVDLSAENGTQLYVPEGFAHGYCTLTPNCEVLYKVSQYYAPGSESGLSAIDPELGIDWGASEFTFSDKDRELPNFSALASPFHYERAS